ncbi:hypothetical protein ACEPPN_010366 [Leptodophora sp. 'Broadleaf-Isolate-01']
MESQSESICFNFCNDEDISWMSEERIAAYAASAALSSRKPALGVLVFFTASATSHQLTRSISPDGRVATYRYHSITEPAVLIAAVSHSRFPPSPNNTTTFPLFPKLPLELRLMIWRASLAHSSRTIELRLSHSLVKKGRSPRYDLVSPTQIPSLLLVSHESRSIALKPPKSQAQAYTPNDFALRYKCPKGTLFNFTLDTLHLRGAQWYNPVFIRDVLPLIPGLGRVRHLSITDDFWPGTSGAFELLFPLLRFACLETLTLCCQLKGLGDCAASAEGVNGGVRTHPGGCHAHEQHTAGSCFVDENEIAPVFSSEVRKRMQYMEDEYGSFMEEVQSGGFGEVEVVPGRKTKEGERQRLRLKEVHVLDNVQKSFGHGWQEPEVFLKAVCVCGIPEGRFNVPLLKRFERRWSIKS